MNPLIRVALVSFFAGSGAGWYVTDAALGKQIALMEADHANEKTAAEKVYRERFIAVQALGDTLSGRLAQTEAHLTQKTKELSHALSKVTTGRACLNGAAVRLLNNVDTGSGCLASSHRLTCYRRCRRCHGYRRRRLDRFRQRPIRDLPGAIRCLNRF